MDGHGHVLNAVRCVGDGPAAGFRVSADPANNISFLATIENAYLDIVGFDTSGAVV